MSEKRELLERQRKEFTVKCLKETLAIVERLYNSDKRRYQPLYGCVNKSVKQHRSPALILQAVKRIYEKDVGATGGRPGARPALDVAEYFFATLRSLEQERDAKKLRGGRAEIVAPKTMDVFADMLRKAGYSVEAPVQGSKVQRSTSDPEKH